MHSQEGALSVPETRLRIVTWRWILQGMMQYVRTGLLISGEETGGEYGEA